MQAQDPEVQQQGMLELTEPGEAHWVLNSMVGQWQATASFMMPSGPPLESQGTSINSWFMDGRFLRSEYTSSFPSPAGDLPFSGYGLIGFNNGAQRYEGFWIDNFGTQMLPISHGQLSSDGSSITFRRSDKDPVSGQMVEMREVLTIVSNDLHHFDMYMKSPGKPEAQSMHIVYTRKL